jgi:hypothetical protein
MQLKLLGNDSGWVFNLLYDCLEHTNLSSTSHPCQPTVSGITKLVFLLPFKQSHVNPKTMLL